MVYITEDSNQNLWFGPKEHEQAVFKVNSYVIIDWNELVTDSAVFQNHILIFIHVS